MAFSMDSSFPNSLSCHFYLPLIKEVIEYYQYQNTLQNTSHYDRPQIIKTPHELQSTMRAKIHPKYDREFVTRGLAMIQTFLERTLKGQNKVINFKLPQELQNAVDLQISNLPCPDSELIAACQAVLEHQVKPYHPHFHNQLFGGFDQFSYFGALMTASINGSVYTYEVSPCYTLMQNQLCQHLRTLVGWETMDGIMTPGGSFANFMALLMARFRKHPESHAKGLYGLKPMKVFTSDVSHYSVKKGVVLCGTGTDNIVYVKSDQNRRMVPQELQKAIELQIQQGNEPFFVNSTIGTTVEGSIDPIGEIGQICKKYGVWHHVDSAFGGALLFSNNLKKNLGSFENVDSITFDPHKALVVPLQASFFLCRYPGLMAASNSANADYLFHKERASYDGSLDVGDKHLMCGRAIDVLKLWTYLKGNGWEEIQRQVQSEHSLAQHVKSYVLSKPERWELVVQEVDTFNICFWYIPKAMKKEQSESDEFYSLLSKVTVLAKKFMIEEGKMLTGYSKSKLPYYFWRAVMSNPFLSQAQADEQMDLIAKYCELAYAELSQQKKGEN